MDVSHGVGCHSLGTGEGRELWEVQAQVHRESVKILAEN